MRQNILFSTVAVLLLFSFNTQAQQKGGWKFVNYSFTDGTSNKETVLMGTTSKMNDIIKYKGEKGSIEISKNRLDKKTGSLLAGVTYQVTWTDPQPTLFPGDKIRLKYGLKTITSKTWKPDQQSVSFNQGLYGIYLLNSKGESFFKNDFNAEIVTGKPVEKGYKNLEEKKITINMGAGFKAVYTYMWDANLTGSAHNAPAEVSQPENKKVSAWYFKSYSLKDGTSTKETVLMGTSS